MVAKPAWKRPVLKAASPRDFAFAAAASSRSDGSGTVSCVARNNRNITKQGKSRQLLVRAMMHVVSDHSTTSTLTFASQQSLPGRDVRSRMVSVARSLPWSAVARQELNR